MALSRPLGIAAMLVALAAPIVPRAAAQEATVIRDLSQSPAEARLRHSGRQGGRNSPEYYGRELATGDFNNDGRQDLAVSADFDTAVVDTSPGRGFVYVYFGTGDGLPSEVDNAEREADCRIYGEKFFGQFGTELAVGDFDGDGYDDIAVSQIESLTINWGNVFIVEGSRIAAEPELRMDEGDFLTRINGRTANAERGTNLHFGFGLAAGDFSGDGIADLAIAALGGDGIDGQRRESGDVCVFLGRRSGWPRDIVGERAAADLYILGRSSYVRMGTELAAGDVDGDGRDELAVATYGSNGPDDTRSFAGDITVYAFGALSPVPLPAAGGPVPARLLWDNGAMAASTTIHGPINGSRIGTSASDGGGRGIAIGDFDGDGVADMLIGSPFYGPPSPNAKNLGALFVVWGDRSLTQRTVVDLAVPGPAASLLAVGQPGVSLGDTVRLADLNGDGRADALAGAPDDREATGYLALYGGRPRPEAPSAAPLAPLPDAVVKGSTPLWRFGEDVVALDASFAGRASLAVGTPQGGFFPFGGRGYAGEINLIDAAPLTAFFPKFPTIQVQGATVVAPNSTATVQIEVDTPNPAAVALTAVGLPGFATLRAVDAAAGLYTLTVAPGLADRGVAEVLLVATDGTGASSSRRIPLTIGFTPAVTAAKLKQVSGQVYKLTIDGTGFSIGDARVYVDGIEQTPVKYPSKFAESGGATVRRLTVKNNRLTLVVLPGQGSSVRVVNPREGLGSQPFPVTR